MYKADIRACTMASLFARLLSSISPVNLYTRNLIKWNEIIWSDYFFFSCICYNIDHSLVEVRRCTMFKNRIPFLYAGYHRFSHPQIKVRMSFNSPRRNNHVSTKHSTRTYNISMRVQIIPTRLSKHVSVCAVVTLMQAEHRYFCLVLHVLYLCFLSF